IWIRTGMTGVSAASGIAEGPVPVLRKLVDQDRAVGERRAAGRGLDRLNTLGVLGQRVVVTRRVVLVDAAGAGRRPLGLGVPRLGVELHADVVEQVQGRTVDGVRRAGTAVVTTQEPHTRRELGRVALERLVTELDAFRDRLGPARDGEVRR